VGQCSHDEKEVEKSKRQVKSIGKVLRLAMRKIKPLKGQHKHDINMPNALLLVGFRDENAEN